MPTATASRPRRKLPAEILSQDEILGLLKACSGRAPTGIRDAALIVVLWRAGLRIGEALAVKPKDVDATGCTVRVLHGKGDKARTAGIDTLAMGYVERWRDARARLWINGHAPLFCTLKGSELSQAHVRAMLRRRADHAGIEKRVHPHGFRHAHAVELAGEFPIHYVQQQLGHSSLAHTQTYLRSLRPRDVIEAIKQRAWGAFE